ncbi:MAG: hypothetical protein ABWJ42_01875 [Sulfolobales archaeon]
MSLSKLSYFFVILVISGLSVNFIPTLTYYINFYPHLRSEVFSSESLIRYGVRADISLTNVAVSTIYRLTVVGDLYLSFYNNSCFKYYLDVVLQKLLPRREVKIVRDSSVVCNPAMIDFFIRRSSDPGERGVLIVNISNTTTLTIPLADWRSLDFWQLRGEIKNSTIFPIKYRLSKFPYLDIAYILTESREYLVLYYYSYTYSYSCCGLTIRYYYNDSKPQNISIPMIWGSSFRDSVEYFIISTSINASGDSEMSSFFSSFFNVFVNYLSKNATEAGKLANLSYSLFYYVEVGYIDSNIRMANNILARILLDFTITWFPVNIILISVGMIGLILTRRRVVR